MLNTLKMHRFKLYILFILISFMAHGQEAKVEAVIDSARIMIGSQANLTLKATAQKGSEVVFPGAKTIGNFEVLEAYPVDTIEQANGYDLLKTYALTQFDAGRYTVPSLTITIDGRNYTTEPLPVEVRDVVVDTTKQKMFDIKPVATQDSEINLWWYLLALLFFALVGMAIWWDVRRRNENRKPVVQLSPIDKAIGGLKKFDYRYNGGVANTKEYYSELTGVLRLYIEETLGVPAMESTTSGLMQALPGVANAKRMTLSQDTYAQIDEVLKNADMVKFALSNPPLQQLSDDRSVTESIIRSIESAIPDPTQEEIEQTEAYKLAQEYKLKQRKRRLIMAAGAIVVIGTLALFGSMRLYSYLQENYIGHSTKELWDGDWVKSEYGNPAITINTPKVLERDEIASYMPKETLAQLQEVQLFRYGVPFGDFFVVIKTMNYLPGIQPNVELVVENTFATWEAQGATNITTAGEKFITDDGFEGIRAYGRLTLSRDNDERFYYEMISFQQLQGLQQVLIMHKDQDEYGIKLADKIKKSLRYKAVR